MRSSTPRWHQALGLAPAKRRICEGSPDCWTVIENHQLSHLIQKRPRYNSNLRWTNLSQKCREWHPHAVVPVSPQAKNASNDSKRTHVMLLKFPMNTWFFPKASVHLSHHKLIHAVIFGISSNYVTWNCSTVYSACRQEQVSMERARCQGRHKISGAWSIEASSLPHKNELLMEFTDPSGRLEEVRITAAGRPGFGELSGWMVGFIHWAVDLRGSKCVRLNSVELLFPFSMNLWGRCNMWPNEDEVLEIALVLSELATIPGARTPNLVIFFRHSEMLAEMALFVFYGHRLLSKGNTSDFRTQIRQKGPGVASDGGKWNWEWWYQLRSWNSERCDLQSCRNSTNN